MPTSGDPIMKQQLAGANGAELALGMDGGEPGPGWTTERTAPVERPAHWSTRVVRSARVTVHVVGGLVDDGARLPVGRCRRRGRP